MMVSHIIREPERWNLLSQEDWWKHILEITFHIHPEDASEDDRTLVVELCKAYDIFNNSSCTDQLISCNSTKVEKKELLMKLVDMFSDAYFKMGTLDTVQIVAENEVPVFQYR
jgi:hypothetical protein